MQAALQEVIMREKEVKEATDKLTMTYKELEKAQTGIWDVKAQLKSQSYSSQESEAIRLSGPTFTTYVVPGRNYNIGTCNVPRELFAAGSCLDLSFMIPTVFRLPGNNILEQVECFFSDKWKDVKKYDFFYFPVKHAIESTRSQENRFAKCMLCCDTFDVAKRCGICGCRSFAQRH